MDDRPLGIVTEFDVLNIYASVDRRDLERLRQIGRFGRLVDQAEHALRRGAGRLQLADDVRHLVDRSGEFARVQHKRRQIAQGDVAEQEQDRAECADQRQRQVVDEIHRRPRHAAVIIRHVIGVHGLLVALVKAADHGFLLMVRLDGFLPGDDFLDVAVQLAELNRPFPEQRTHLAHHVPREKDRGGDGDSEYQHQLRGDQDHHDQRAAHRDRACGDLKQIRRQRRVDRIDIVGNAADNIAGLVGVKVAHGQLREMVEHVLAHLVHDFLAEMDHQHRQDIRQHGGNEIEHEHQAAVIEYGGEIDLAGLRADRVDGPAGERRADEGEQVARDGEKQGGDHHADMAHQVPAQPDQDALAVLRLFGHCSWSLHVNAPPIWEWLISR